MQDVDGSAAKRDLMKIDSTVIAQLITTAIGFLVFFWIAKKLFWTGILKTIEDRQAHIRGEFDRIDSMQQQVNALQADYSKRIAEIETEARAKMQEAIAQGKKIAEEIGEQARKDATAAQERTKQSIEIEIEKAKAQLKEEVVRMTLRATEKIIAERLDDQKHRQLVSSFIEEEGPGVVF